MEYYELGSESDSDRAVFYSATSSEMSGFHGEELMEKYDIDMQPAYLAYYSYFEDPESYLRRLLPEEYESEEGAFIADLTQLLLSPEPEVADDGVPTAVASLHDLESLSQTDAATSHAEEPPPPPPTSSVSAVVERVLAEDGSTILVKESPASRLLRAHLEKAAARDGGGGADSAASTECIFFDAGKDAKRASLKEQFCASFPGSDIFTGYVKAQPTGWALFWAADPSALDGIKSAFPEKWRLPTWDDLPMFYRSTKKGPAPHTAEEQTEGAMKVTAVAPQSARAARKKKQPPPPPRLKPSTVATRHSRDVDRLRRRIDAAGGMDKVRFLAVDVEAACVLPGGYPLPLEIAMLPVRVRGEEASLRPPLEAVHFFTHPGLVPDVQTAIYLSCMLQQGHAIPYCNYRFLRYDYAAMARQLSPYLDDPTVVLVNKGSTIDLQALRWIFAAAAEVADCSITVPEIEAVPMYDISTLRQLLLPPEGCAGPPASARSGGGGLEPDVGPVSPQKMRSDCWYHAAVRTGITATPPQALPGEGGEDGSPPEALPVPSGFENAHCAMHDAATLLLEVESLLYPEGLRSEATA